MAIADHIVTRYTTLTHHGIDLGDGTIIEYSDNGTGRLIVRRVLYSDFLARGPSFVMSYPPGAALAPEETVRFAFSRLYEQQYDIFNNNCEHFALWCKTGHHHSPQADTLKAFAMLGFITLVVRATN